MNETLSLPRLWFLLRADFITGFRSLLLVSAVLALIILVVAMLVPIRPVANSGSHGPYFTVFNLALFAWGIVATSRAFRALHDKNTNEAWLLLPASSLEKTLARLLALTLGIVAYLAVFTTAVSIIVESLNLLFYGHRNAFFDPLDPAVRDRIPLYILLQSIYFLGAAWFRRGHFIKTTLAITLCVAGLAVLAMVTARIAFADFPLELSPHLWNPRLVLSTELESLHGMARTALLALMVLLPVACWSIAWLRVSEAQTSDGI